MRIGSGDWPSRHTMRPWRQRLFDRYLRAFDQSLRQSFLDMVKVLSGQGDGRLGIPVA